MLSFLRRLPTCVLSSRVRLAGFCCYDDRAAREGARVLAGFGGSHCRTQHTEPAGVVEVDLRKLRGEDDGIAEVLMCRHKARNALGHVFVSQMRALMSVLSNDDSAVRVLVFRSLVPGVFCAGADLKERALMDDRESDLFVHGLRGLMTQIASLPMPTIAAIDGVALGGGLELALACDLRTAAYSAQMGLIETTRGLLPGAGGSQRLPRTVGITLAKELIFTGKRVGGRGAMEMGLVNRAVDQNETGDAAYSEALSLAREILPQAPIAVRMAKEAMNRGTEVDITSAMAIERMCYAQVIPTRDRREGMAAFIEKRPPRYTGK
ncbi:enoyl-CoA hydratase domain-containing protein 2, mitochondrial isoform X2 [Dunckerocampus dactyliophorus]|uniref:enoyl-CoA hydratase domain-containing protein 2, mitochondrial isoform X2 n=1 Tax=Dunckerocampus dactyliophorus TaxID=161453 RepID=UPI00240563DA|nr:enoyl-CoA hydratase domain-containing protein 2, mitochondrial isoform X2 [Dunckerocampus dactyliophorus]